MGGAAVVQIQGGGAQQQDKQPANNQRGVSVYLRLSLVVPHPEVVVHPLKGGVHGVLHIKKTALFTRQGGERRAGVDQGHHY